jgi:hypothetical protein
MPGIDVSLLWHRRHEQDTAQRWLRDTLIRAAGQVSAGTSCANPASIWSNSAPH